MVKITCTVMSEQFVQPLNSNGKPLCTIAKTNIIAIKECK